MFFRKRTYLLTWSYYSNQGMVYTDIIKARDINDMWRKHKKEHPIATYMVDVEEI